MAAANLNPASGNDDQEEPITFSEVLSESKRIIRLHYRHFQALNFIFFFPLSLITLLLQSIQKNIQPDPSKIFRGQNPYHFFLLLCLLTTFSTIISLSGFASISYSTYHLYKGDTVDLISSLKSISHSFLPIVSTYLVLCLILILSFSPVLVLVILTYSWFHGSSYFIPLVIVIVLIFFVVLVWFQVNWLLAYSVVVVESKWGFAPLRRSSDLVQKHKRVALSLLLYVVLLVWLVTWSWNYLPGDRSWSSDRWWFVVYLLAFSFVLSQCQLVTNVATTVLYLYCRKSHVSIFQIPPEKIPLLQ